MKKTILLINLLSVINLCIGQYDEKYDRILELEKKIMQISINEYVDSLNADQTKMLRDKIKKKIERKEKSKRSKSTGTKIDSLSTSLIKKENVKVHELHEIELEGTKKQTTLFSDSINKIILKQYLNESLSMGAMRDIGSDSIKVKRIAKRNIKKERETLLQDFEKELTSLSYTEKGNNVFKNQAKNGIEDNIINLRTQRLNNELDQLKELDNNISNHFETQTDRLKTKKDSANEKVSFEEVNKKFLENSELLDNFKNLIALQDMNNMSSDKLNRVWELINNSKKYTPRRIKDFAEKNQNSEKLTDSLRKQKIVLLESQLTSLESKKASLTSARHIKQTESITRSSSSNDIINNREETNKKVDSLDNIIQGVIKKIDMMKQEETPENFIVFNEGMMNFNVKNSQRPNKAFETLSMENPIEDKTIDQYENEYKTSFLKESKEHFKEIKYKDKGIMERKDEKEQQIDSVRNLEIKNKKFLGMHDFSLGSIAQLETQLSFNYNIGQEITSRLHIGINIQSIIVYEQIQESLRSALIGAFSSYRIYKNNLDGIIEVKFGKETNQLNDKDAVVKNSFGYRYTNIGIRPKMSISKTMMITATILYRINQNVKDNSEALNFRIGIQKNMMK